MALKVLPVEVLTSTARASDKKSSISLYWMEVLIAIAFRHYDSRNDFLYGHYTQISLVECLQVVRPWLFINMISGLNRRYVLIRPN